MNVVKLTNINQLKDNQLQDYKLAIVSRNPIAGADIFFEILKKTQFQLSGKISKHSCYENIKNLLSKTFPKHLQKTQIYQSWLYDMSIVSGLFCDIHKGEDIGFFLTTRRGCARYHVDNVPLRLLVTYSGQGTEWIPDTAANRKAFISGAPNNEIVKDKSKRQFIENWDISIFRGGSNGLLHRTPDTALKEPTILMRLDCKSFFDEISKKLEA